MILIQTSIKHELQLNLYCYKQAVKEMIKEMKSEGREGVSIHSVTWQMFPLTHFPRSRLQFEHLVKWLTDPRGDPFTTRGDLRTTNIFYSGRIFSPSPIFYLRWETAAFGSQLWVMCAWCAQTWFKQEHKWNKHMITHWLKSHSMWIQSNKKSWCDVLLLCADSEWVLEFIHVYHIIERCQKN